MCILLELMGSNDGMSKFSSERQTVKVKKNGGTPVLSLGRDSRKEHRLECGGGSCNHHPEWESLHAGGLAEGWILTIARHKAACLPGPTAAQVCYLIAHAEGRQCLFRRVTDVLCTGSSKTHWSYTLTVAQHLPTCTNLRQDKKQKSDHLLCKKLFPSLSLTFPLTWCQSDFPLPSSACLATACLEGAGPLASLAACDSSTLLCASFHSGIHVLQLRHCEELEEVAVF